MFTFFSKTIRRAKVDLRKAHKGQVAIVLILMTAVAIIIYASTLNLGRVAELKTLTTIAADVSAAQMASSWASSAENLFQTQLGGEDEADELTLCKAGPLRQLFISLVIIIIAIVVTIVCWGACGVGVWTLVAGIAAAALTVGAMILQMLVLDPGITSMWAKMMANLPPADQFLERGIMAGLQHAVNDPIAVPDLHDTNGDGLFGYNALGIPKDRANRFGIYFTNRLQKMKIAGHPSIKDFKKALTTFMGSFWEITNCSANPADPCCGTNPPSECNPCCQPLTDSRGRPLRPGCCDGVDPSVSACGSSANCNASSEYGTAYPPRYDPYYEKFPNSSFRGQFGLDDENRFFHTNPLHDNTRPQVAETEVHTDADGVSRKIFRFDDVKSAMVFPVFWKFSDWGTDLGQLTLDPNDAYQKYECHYCDPKYPPMGSTQCNDISPLLSLLGTLAGPATAAGGLSPQLSLPNPPGNYNGGNCAFDPRDPRDQKKIIRPDMVKTIEELIVFPENRYAIDCGEVVGKWKRGTDLYCSTTWPYSLGCAKAGGPNCTDSKGNPVPCTYPCGDSRAGNPAMWPDDLFDDFMIFSKEFAILAQNLIEMDDDAALAADFNTWYPWLSPTGEVTQWRNQLQDWSDKINKWLNTISFTGSDCDGALCVPPASSMGIANVWPTREVGTPSGQCPGLKKSEAATFGSGHVNDVLACLDYNIANVSKFASCGAGASSCTEANCSNLPRSVLVNAGPTSPDYFDTNDFVVPRDPDVTAFAACLNSCSTSTCNKPSLPTSPTPWQGPTKTPVITQYPTASQTFTPPSQPSCAPSCQPCPSCILNCSSCPQNPSDSAAIACFKTCNAAYDACVNTKCPDQGLVNAAQGSCLHWNLGNDFYLQAAKSWMLAKGSCLDEVGGFPQNAPDGLNYSANWQPKLQAASTEAQNQAVKLQKRRDFLAARANEMQNMKNFFDTEIAAMDTLLAAAKEVSDAQSANEKQHSLPGFAIYGWKSEVPAGATRGQWHIVRVDTREPGRCNGNCGKASSPPDPKNNGKPMEPGFPTIKTYTLPPPWWVGVITGGPTFLLDGWTRCYSVGDVFDRYKDCNDRDDYQEARQCFKGGVVKAQVIRWDENQSEQLTFPGGFKLWQFKFNNPLASGGASANSLDTICPSLTEASGAFMLNRAPDGSSADPEEVAYRKCWDQVNKILEHGVASKACAEYYFHDQTPTGFNLKFVNCPNIPGDI